MLAILALDVSKSATGWAYGAPGEVPTSGVYRLGAAGATEDEVWRNGLVWLNTQMQVMNPDIVAIEAAWEGNGGRSAHTSTMLLGLQAVMRAVVKARKPGRALMMNVSTARKVFTGRGSYASGEAKAAVQAECLRRGWLTAENLDPDRADALCVWCAAAAQQLPELAFTQPKPKRKV